MNERNFQQLATQIKTDDKRGLEFVFEETSRYCIRTLIKKTSCNLADAEDVYMDAIIIFRENILSGKLVQLSNLRTYLFGICWNVWRDLNRAQAKWQFGDGEVERQLMLLVKPEEYPFAADSNEHVQVQIQRIQKALNMLSEKCRKLLCYVYIDQRPQKEIADLMEFASPNVVKVTRHRCYQQWISKISTIEFPAHGTK